MCTNQPERWLFSSPHDTFFTVAMSPLFFDMHFAVLHVLFCRPCNLFCTTNDLFNVPGLSCAPSAIWYEITIHFLKICCWIKCTFWKYYKKERGQVLWIAVLFKDNCVKNSRSDWMKPRAYNSWKTWKFHCLQDCFRFVLFFFYDNMNLIILD